MTPEPLPPAVLAAYAHVDAMVPRADGNHFGALWWHGWALREAYLAGVYAERGRCVEVVGDEMGDPDLSCRGLVDRAIGRILEG